MEHANGLAGVIPAWLRGVAVLISLACVSVWAIIPSELKHLGALQAAKGGGPWDTAYFDYVLPHPYAIALFLSYGGPFWVVSVAAWGALAHFRGGGRVSRSDVVFFGVVVGAVVVEWCLLAWAAPRLRFAAHAHLLGWF